LQSTTDSLDFIVHIGYVNVLSLLYFFTILTNLFDAFVEFDQPNFIAVVGRSASLICRVKRGRNIDASDFEIWILTGNKSRQILDPSVIRPLANSSGVMLHYSNITGDEDKDLPLNKHSLIECAVPKRELQERIVVIIGCELFFVYSCRFI